MDSPRLHSPPLWSLQGHPQPSGNLFSGVPPPISTLFAGDYNSWYRPRVLLALPSPSLRLFFVLLQPICWSPSSFNSSKSLETLHLRVDSIPLLFIKVLYLYLNLFSQPHLGFPRPPTNLQKHYLPDNPQPKIQRGQQESKNGTPAKIRPHINT